MKVIIKTVGDEVAVWNFLLSYDCTVTPLRPGVTAADVPDSLVPALRRMANVSFPEETRVWGRRGGIT